MVHMLYQNIIPDAGAPRRAGKDGFRSESLRTLRRAIPSWWRRRSGCGQTALPVLRLSAKIEPREMA
jgi:hypothetical protein